MTTATGGTRRAPALGQSRGGGRTGSIRAGAGPSGAIRRGGPRLKSGAERAVAAAFNPPTLFPDISWKCIDLYIVGLILSAPNFVASEHSYCRNRHIKVRTTY